METSTGKLCLALVGAVFLSACATKPPLVAECGRQGKGVRNGPALVGLEYGTQDTPIPLDSIQFSDKSIVKSLSIQRLVATRTATNSVQVSARFISCEANSFAVRVRTSFFDSSLALTEASSAWQTIYFQPHLITSYEERSISPQADHYLLEVMR